MKLKTLCVVLLLGAISRLNGQMPWHQYRGECRAQLSTPTPNPINNGADLISRFNNWRNCILTRNLTTLTNLSRSFPHNPQVINRTEIFAIQRYFKRDCTSLRGTVTWIGGPDQTMLCG